MKSSFINHNPLPCKTHHIHTLRHTLQRYTKRHIHKHTHTNQQTIRIETLILYTLRFNGCYVAPILCNTVKFTDTYDIKRHQKNIQTHTNKQSIQKCIMYLFISIFVYVKTLIIMWLINLMLFDLLLSVRKFPIDVQSLPTTKKENPEILKSMSESNHSIFN